jgi:hypothetical protein
MHRESKLIFEAYNTVVQEQANDALLKYLQVHFEDLFSVTDSAELLERIRARVETPESVQSMGPAMTGNIVETIFKAITDEQKTRAAYKQSENSEQQSAMTNTKPVTPQATNAQRSYTEKEVNSKIEGILNRKPFNHQH